MDNASPLAGNVASGREQTATRIVFFVVGFAAAAWAPLIPLTKAKLGLDDRQLGALLLCLGLGSITVMPLTGGLAARFGCRRVILVASGLMCAALPFLVAAPSALLLAVAVFAVGAGLGSTDVVMNIQAVIVERAGGRPMMSGFHAMFSVGGIAGAGAMTRMLWAHVNPLGSIVAVAVANAALLVSAAPGLLTYGGDASAPVFAVPRGRVLLIGAMCFAMFLAEGSVMDWSGVLLSGSRGVEKGHAGIGYVAFATTMTVGRLTGDRVVRALGRRTILLAGSLCAATGFALAAAVPAWPVTVAGFALVGVGAANVVPVLFTAAGRQRSMPGNLALAAVTTMGYIGILAGPGGIGFVARQSSLPVALLMVAALVVGIAIFSGRVMADEPV